MTPDNKRRHSWKKRQTMTTCVHCGLIKGSGRPETWSDFCDPKYLEEPQNYAVDANQGREDASAETKSDLSKRYDPRSKFVDNPDTASFDWDYTKNPDPQPTPPQATSSREERDNVATGGTERREWNIYDGETDHPKISGPDIAYAEVVKVREIGQGLIPVEDVNPLLEAVRRAIEFDLDDPWHELKTEYDAFREKHPGVK